MVRFLVAVFVCCAAVVFLGPPAAGAAQVPVRVGGSSGLEMTGSSAQATYRNGEQVRLLFTLTNRRVKACLATDVQDGTLTVTAMSRDGVAVQPSMTMFTYAAGLGKTLRSTLKSLAPGGRIGYQVETLANPDGGPQQVYGLGYSPSERNVLSRWSVDRPGRYTIAVSYGFPRVAGAPAGVCAGRSNAATVSFTVHPAGTRGSSVVGIPLGGPDSGSWLVPGGLALLVVLLVVVALARSQRRRMIGAGFAASVLGAAAVVVTAGPASATLSVAPGMDADFTAHFNTCLDMYKPQPNGRPDKAGIVPYLKRSQYRITVVKRAPDVGSASWADDIIDSLNGKGTGTVIAWNPVDPSVDEPGVSANDCAVLYHELDHAFQNARGENNFLRCNESVSTKTNEVVATLAENSYRKVWGLPLRTQYDEGVPLPASASDCHFVPPVKNPGPGKTSGGCAPRLIGGARPREVAAGDACAASNGDPHLATFDQPADRAHLDFQGAGEFVATRSSVPGMEIQTRQVPIPGFTDVSVNEAVAMNVAGDRFAVYNDDNGTAARLAGAPVTPTGRPTTLPHGGSVTRTETEDGTVYEIRWPDGSTVWLTAMGPWGLKMEVNLAARYRGTVGGLLGTFDDNPSDDVTTRQGQVLADPPSFEQLHHVWGESWRISQGESLFDYAPGQSTATFTDRSFPHAPATVADPATARALCAAAGATRAPFADDCALDLGITGLPDFAESAAAEQGFATPSGNGGIGDGATHTGTLAAGSPTVLPLDLAGATVFRLVGVQGPQDMQIELHGPASDNAPGFVFTDPYIYRADTHGGYQLALTSATGGRYSFQLVTHKERRLPTSVGAAVAGRLDVPGRVDLYTFTPARTMRVHLDPGGGPCNDDLTAELVEDTPRTHGFSPYELCTDVSLGQVEAGKPYLLAVYSDHGSTVTDYHLTIDPD